MMPDWSDLLGAIILGTASMIVLAVAELWIRLGTPRPEWTRKLVHVAGGMCCLLFPFLIESVWVVGLLALSMSSLFALGGKTGFLKSLHGVARKSRGSEYYPIAIFLVFALSDGERWLYLASVLVLAVGDAFAALIGSQYGRIRYQVEESQKSLEGSLVFMVIAFLAIHLPLLLMTDLSRPVCVLAALLVAILATGFEAICLGGTDNLFVPLAVLIILRKIVDKPLDEVVFQNISLVVLGVGMALLVRRAKALNVGALIAVVLFTYGAWSLGGWQWALPIALGTIAFVLCARPRGPSSTEHLLRVRNVFHALLLPFAVLAAGNGLGCLRAAFGPYLAASAVALTLILEAEVSRDHTRGALALGNRVLVGFVAALFLGTLPWLAQNQGWSQLLALGTVTSVIAALFPAVRAILPSEPDSDWGASRLLVTTMAAATLLAGQAVGWLPSWAPANGLFAGFGGSG